MKSTAAVILLTLPFVLNAQNERKLIREGYKNYMDEKYSEAEVDFRKAEELNQESFTARYNTSAAMYQQEKLEESAERFAELLAEADDKETEAKLYHNLGNSLLESDKLEESIEAYKKSLRLNPADEDTRYNLAYALEKLKKKQQQNQQDQEKNQDKENQKEEEQQDNKEQEQNSEDQKEQKDKQQQQEQERKKQQEQQVRQLSKEDAERLLDAILQKEKEVKEKVDKKKAAAAKTKTDKDW